MFWPKWGMHCLFSLWLPQLNHTERCKGNYTFGRGNKIRKLTEYHQSFDVIEMEFSFYFFKYVENEKVDLVYNS